ncbi:MAG: inositol monophosphatase [Deltaproteobacteria bacterium]|nr:inositol monophosphatase [Deltaproteobacteria bacterium]
MQVDFISDIEELVRNTGEELLRLWPGAGNKNLEIKYKPDGSPVTEADLLANDLIVSKIRELFPDDGIISEELEFSAAEASKERVWVMDPLDGTNSFISGRDDFSILISCCVAGEAQFGVMYFPARNLFAHGTKGRGAELNGQKLAVSGEADLKPSKVYHRWVDLVPGDYLFEGKLDSGMAFLMLAQGELDATVMQYSRFGAHDFAAPAVIIREAGGKFTDEKGNDATFNLGSITAEYFVASNGKVHQKTLELILPA